MPPRSWGKVSSCSQSAPGAGHGTLNIVLVPSRGRVRIGPGRAVAPGCRHDLVPVPLERSSVLVRQRMPPCCGAGPAGWTATSRSPCTAGTQSPGHTLNHTPYRSTSDDDFSSGIGYFALTIFAKWNGLLSWHIFRIAVFHRPQRRSQFRRCRPELVYRTISLYDCSDPSGGSNG